MISPIKNIARSATPQKSLNILAFICDGYFDSMLCNALPQHKFYGPVNDNNKPTGWNFKLCPQPDNFHCVPNIHTNHITSKVNLDLIICHDRTSQYDISQQFAHNLHINIIIIEHIVNTEQLDMISMIPLLKKTKRNTSVFMADHMVDKFKIPGTIIKHGIANLYCQKKKNQILLFNADQQAIESLASHINIPIVSHDIYDLTTKQYHTLLQESKFYFNLEAEANRIQLPVLHAMSAGCVVVSISSPVINDLITHMENGLVVENMDELLNIWNNIDKTNTVKISTNANQYILNNHDPEQFKQKWQDVLTTTFHKTYIK